MKTVNGIDTAKAVQLANPQPGEEAMFFIITNYNEVTERAYITEINSKLPLAPEELVSVYELKNVD